MFSFITPKAILEFRLSVYVNSKVIQFVANFLHPIGRYLFVFIKNERKMKRWRNLNIWDFTKFNCFFILLFIFFNSNGTSYVSYTFYSSCELSTLDWFMFVKLWFDWFIYCDSYYWLLILYKNLIIIFKSNKYSIHVRFH